MGKSKKIVGQAAQLRHIKKQMVMAIVMGVVLLVLSIGSNVSKSVAQSSQLEVTMALNQYRLGSKTLTASVQTYAVDGGQQYYDAYMAELNEDKNRDKALETLKKNDIKDEEWDILNEISGLSEGLVPAEEKAIASVQKGDMKAAQSQVFSQSYEETVTNISEKTDTLINDIQKRMSDKQNLLTVAWIVCQVAFVVAVMYVAILILKTLRFAENELLNPIKKVSEQMAVLAHGDFSQELDLKEDESEVGTMVSSIAFMKKNMHEMIREISGILENMGNGNYVFEVKKEYVGEFTQIKESFLVIGEKMRETLLTVRSVAEQIDSGSEQLACAAQDLAEGSTAQAIQVADLATVINQMSKSMEHNAEAAEESVEIASQAGQTLAAGNEKMEELKSAIAEINKCSEQIETIIATIEDIASQTNLLSLNAAIEAARAGEAGKGFAVVAEQVKSLAEESAKSAGLTRELIEKTVMTVDKGIEIADETVANMSEVMTGAKVATEKMGQISMILVKEVDNIHKINETISSVSSIVDNNSATSEETAAVSEELKAQVESMVQMMDFFVCE